MNNFPDLKKPTHLIATLGGVGNAKHAPGTWGSAVSLVLFIIISHYTDNLALLVLATTIFAIWICHVVSVDLDEKDHKAIVIDELAGMWIGAYPAIFYTTQSERISFVVLAFILFRLFDIIKPFPISYVDKNLKGGLGIVLDDVIAGIIAASISILLMTVLFA